MQDFPFRAWVYSAIVAAAALAGIVHLNAGRNLHVWTLLALGFLFVFAEAVPVTLTHVTISVGFLVAIASVVAVGAGPAAAAAAFASLDRDLLSRKDRVGRLVFNAAQFSLSTVALGVVYRATGGPEGVLDASDFPWMLGPLVLGTAAFFVANTVLVSGMVSLVRKVSWFEVLWADYRTAPLSYLLLAGLGVIVGVLAMEVSWAAGPFVLIPLLGARHVLHTARRLQETFDATLRTLVTALEAKDPYTRGHAERVSVLSARVARELGFGTAKAQRVGYAALMHDVGKVTVETRVLQKPGKLSADEYDHMKVHSIRGAEIVSEIDLLADMVDGVRHHHERLDGGGYPDRLGGTRLSPVAKILMVCDAFDSMTSTRSYRKAMPMEKAFSELRRCEGTQFDPATIDALERAIARWGWEPAPESYEGEQTPRPEIVANSESQPSRAAV